MTHESSGHTENSRRSVVRRCTLCAVLSFAWLAVAVATNSAKHRNTTPQSTAHVVVLNIVEFSATPGRGVVVLATNRRIMQTPKGRLAAYAINAAIGGVMLFSALQLRVRFRRTPQLPVEPNSIPVFRSLSRRAFLIDATSAATLTLGAGALTKAAIIDPWSLRTERYRTPLRDLPNALIGFRIVVISDTHLGPRVSANFVRQAVQHVLSLNPEIIVLGGDYIDRRETPEEVAELFAPLVDACPGRVVGVLGNHDWYGDASGISKALSALGVRMIDNDRVYIGPDRHLHEAPLDEALCLAGVGDLEEDKIDLPHALRDAPEKMPRIMIAHEPDTAETREFTINSAPRIDLMISGHTHGGQVRLPLVGTPIVPSRYGQKYAGGLVQGPRFPVIVSRGVGMSILPIRWGVPPEIVEITLTTNTQ